MFQLMEQVMASYEFSSKEAIFGGEFFFIL
jgi:hypothetical protein